MVDKSYSDLPIGEVQVSDVFPFNDGVPTTFQDTYTHIEDFAFHTGVRSGLGLTINAVDTLFNIAAGTAIIVNRDPDPRASVVTRITFPQTLAIVDPFVTTSLFTFVFMISDGVGGGTLVLRDNPPPSTLADLSDLAFLGQLRHGTGTSITSIDDNPIMAHGSSSSHMAELVLAGGVRLAGASITSNGANLQVDIAAGILEQFGRGVANSQNNPNEFESPAQAPIPVGNFVKLFIDAVGDVVTDFSNNLLDPAQFNEDGLGTLESVQANNFTVVRVFVAAGTNAVIFYYGTEAFSTAIGALSAVEPTFVEHPNTIQTSPVAKIAIKENVTDFAAALASGDAVIQLIMRRV